jgi:Fe-S-cluster-containing hydrogenase component 2
MATDQAKGCHHCQRLVVPTMHGRNGARVDYFRTFTGAGRVEMHEDPKTDSLIRVVRVDELKEIVTCRTCWTRPAVRAKLKHALQTGEI